MNKKEEDVNKPDFDFDSSEEILELIPVIWKRVKLRMDRELEKLKPIKKF